MRFHVAVGVFHRFGLGDGAQIDEFTELSAGGRNPIVAIEVESFKSFAQGAFGIAFMRVKIVRYYAG